MSAEGAQVVGDEGAIALEVPAAGEQGEGRNEGEGARELESAVLPEPPIALAERAEHPSGEVFFSGEAGNLSDAEAEEMARQQLARCGLLRGQRVRVGD
jgi:hypothetical protein